jgi:hypothetical protein
MTTRNVVSHDEWVAARKKHLAKEKEFTRLRDQLSRERRGLPWESVEKEYTFEGENGRQTLGEIFEGRSQLVISSCLGRSLRRSPPGMVSARTYLSWGRPNLDVSGAEDPRGEPRTTPLFFRNVVRRPRSTRLPPPVGSGLGLLGPARSYGTLLFRGNCCWRRRVGSGRSYSRARYLRSIQVPARVDRRSKSRQCGTRISPLGPGH